MKSTGIIPQKHQEAFQVGLAIVFLIASSIEAKAAVEGQRQLGKGELTLIQDQEEFEGVAKIYVKNKKGEWDFVGDGSYFPQGVGNVGRGSYYPLNNGVELTMHQGFLNEIRETEFFREKEMKVVMGKREFIGKTVNTGDQGSNGEFYVDRMFISFDGLTAAKKEELKKVNGLYPEYIKATDNEDSKAALDYMKNQGYDPIIVGRAKVYEGDYRLYAYDVSKCGEIDSYVDGTFSFTLNGCNPSYLRSGAPLMFRHRKTGKIYRGKGLPAAFGNMTNAPSLDQIRSTSSARGNLAVIQIEPQSPASGE